MLSASQKSRFLFAFVVGLVATTLAFLLIKYFGQLSLMEAGGIICVGGSIVAALAVGIFLKGSNDPHRLRRPIVLFFVGGAITGTALFLDAAVGRQLPYIGWAAQAILAAYLLAVPLFVAYLRRRNRVGQASQ
jgi:hypothetical protein